MQAACLISCLVGGALLAGPLAGFAAPQAETETSSGWNFELRGRVQRGLRVDTNAAPHAVRYFVFWSDGRQYYLWCESPPLPPPKTLATNRSPHAAKEFKRMSGISGGPQGLCYGVNYFSNTTNYCELTITTNGAPRVHGTDAICAWLALGTLHYRGPDPELPPPLPPYGRLHETVDGGRFRARWSRLERPPHFTQRITYMNRGYLVTPRARDGEETVSLGPAYANGFPELVLQVTATTNAGGLTFPARWEMTRYGPTGGGGTHVVDLLVGEVWEIITNPPPRPAMPPLTKETLIADHRLPLGTNRNPVRYMVMDRRIPSVEEARKIQTWLQKRRQPGNARPSLLALMLLLSLFPAAVWGIQQWRNRPATSPADAAIADAPAACSTAPAVEAGASSQTWPVLKLLLAQKALLLAGMLAVAALTPAWLYSASGRGLGLVKTERPLSTWLGRFERHFQHIDGGFYEEIARRGYAGEAGARAFYPLWPALMRAGSWLTGGHTLVAGFLMANLFSLAAAWLLYDWVARLRDVPTARWSLLFFLCMPGAAFFPLVYTESLFLLLAILCLRWLSAGRFWAAAAVAMLLPLTRAVGFFILLPFLWELITRKRPAKDYLCLLPPLAGIAAYFALFHFLTGNALAGFEAQKYFPNQPSLKNVVHVSGWATAFLNITGLHTITGSALDRLCFLLFLASWPLLWRLNPTWFWYCVPVGLVPALTNWYVSYTRYTAALFPLCILLAVLLNPPKRRLVAVSVAALLALAQLYLLWRYLRLDWA